MSWHLCTYVSLKISFVEKMFELFQHRLLVQQFQILEFFCHFIIGLIRSTKLNTLLSILLANLCSVLSQVGFLGRIHYSGLKWIKISSTKHLFSLAAMLNFIAQTLKFL